MWQKLNRLDVLNLEKARIQIINVLQLVSASPRSFNTNGTEKFSDWLNWHQDTTSLVSNKFGKNSEIDVSMDIEKFILSINGQDNQREHLVLSGMSYPMAYGWMSIKLGSFNLDSSLFNDAAPYELEASLKPESEINTEDQFTYDQIVIHYSNAYFLFNELKNKLSIEGNIKLDPSNANMILVSESGRHPNFGFSLGNKSFPEPYYFISVEIDIIHENINPDEFTGIWNSSRSEIVLMTSDFLNQNQDLEFQKVMDFIENNISKLPPV